jgi:hypothetical protein
MVIIRFLIYSVVFYLAIIFIRAIISVVKNLSKKPKNDIKDNNTNSQRKKNYIDKSDAKEVDYEDLK